MEFYGMLALKTIVVTICVINQKKKTGLANAHSTYTRSHKFFFESKVRRNMVQTDK